MLLAAAPLQGAREVPLPAIARDVVASVPIQQTPAGLAFDVSEYAALFLPLRGAEGVEVDYQSTGIVLLTWTSGDGRSAPRVHAPPWHHQALATGGGRATLDLRTTEGWSPDQYPFLFFEGTGRVVLTAIRARPAPEGAGEWVRSRDEAIRWAPLRIGHTTINHLDTPIWKASSDLLLYEVLGVAFLVLAVGGSLGWLAYRRRWSPAPFVAVAGVGVALLGNGSFAVRAWPALALAPQPDAGARLRANLHMDPELGALAALARERIGPGERVGVQTAANDWFAWETLCFHLAPRPCVHVVPGTTVFSGLHVGERQVADQLDVVVFVRDDAPLLPGFSPVASVGPKTFLARRR